MKIQFSNAQIYSIAIQLNNQFLKEDATMVLPVRVNFPLQRNIKTFTDAANLIDITRLDIGRKYGTYDPKTESYTIKEENMDKVNQELKNLSEIEQVIDVQKIPLSALSNIALTTAQMQALLFMIEED